MWSETSKSNYWLGMAMWKRKTQGRWFLVVPKTLLKPCGVFLCKNTDWLGTSTYSPIEVYTHICIWYTVISQWKMLWDQLNIQDHLNVDWFNFTKPSLETAGNILLESQEWGPHCSNTSSHHGYLQCRCGRMNVGPKQCHWHMLGGCLAWRQVCRELEHPELPPAEIQKKEPITAECGRKNKQTNNTITHTKF